MAIFYSIVLLTASAESILRGPEAGGGNLGEHVQRRTEEEDLEMDLEEMDLEEMDLEVMAELEQEREESLLPEAVEAQIEELRKEAALVFGEAPWVVGQGSEADRLGVNVDWSDDWSRLAEEDPSFMKRLDAEATLIQAMAAPEENVVVRRAGSDKRRRATSDSDVLDRAKLQKVLDNNGFRLTTKERVRVKQEKSTGGVLSLLSSLIKGYGDFVLMHKAPNYEAKRKACQRLKERPVSKLVRTIAKTLHSAIDIGVAMQITVLGYDYTWGGSMIAGEKGEWACAETESHGFNLGLIGVSKGTLITISPALDNPGTDISPFGGWKTVSGSFDAGFVCVTVDLPFIESIKFSAVIETARYVEKHSVVDVMKKHIIADAKGIRFKKGKAGQFFDEFTRKLLRRSGIAAVGISMGVGLEITDVIPFLNFLPTVAITSCASELVWCDGGSANPKGCDGKTMAKPFRDGHIVAFGINAHKCNNPATYWFGKAAVACGSEPKWNDRTRCLAGTSCEAQCKNGHSYHWDLVFTACGQVKRTWNDGTVCAKGTTCKMCKKTATWWPSKFITACGSEPKWNDRTRCAAGTTCKQCKNGHSYHFDLAFTACGQVRRTWNDGTVCAKGTTCKMCKNGANWWPTKFITACGREPCWGKGTVCGTGTTCHTCCSGNGRALCPWYWFGVCKCN